MNLTHPLLPDYTGPTEGWFTFLHHKQPVEYSANVIERRDYVLAHKPSSEQRIRGLACQFLSVEHIPAYLDTAWQALDTARQALDTAWQAYATAWQAYDTARQALDTARQALDTAWQAYATAERAYATARQAYDTARLSTVLPGTPWAELYDEAKKALRFEVPK